MAEHTPGPWRIVREDQTVILSPDTSIAMLFRDGDVEYSDFKSPFDDVFEANARLIAAAPDLLEALKMIILDDNAMDALWQHFDSMEMDKISAAIAKANAPTQPSESR